MIAPTGPGRPFALLFERDQEGDLPLPEPFRAIYGGDWRLPRGERRPYTFVNFATSHDGRISFNVPGHRGAADVSERNPHDRWLMGLLRARADAVMVGDGTLRASPSHVWTAEHIFPADAAAFAALRRAEGRERVPLLVILSQTGELPGRARVFRTGQRVLVATTTRGVKAARAVARRGGVEVLAFGTATVQVRRLLAMLVRRFAVRTLLCEGGARTYGTLLRAGCVDDEFLTICPLIIGDGSRRRPRPSLVEGAGFLPGVAPHLSLHSVRRAGDYLFLRSRVARAGRRRAAGEGGA
ncbi:MAG: RibD family protein [Armatimonadota bacterium]|nr:RibD family protein [Armatimonadota bacterium]MDR7448299.1 RibD family protein [Armatimonadota bacterium]MDR7458328.1 RibD family protein [Armatimonadota bacterium]MDR7478369.1 RibD family protein [Armatimonadota bacterium]MDR7487303.1 RibD family protein [Armatimonadota bacterium]